MKPLITLIVGGLAAGVIAQSHAEMAKGNGKKIPCAVMRANKVDINTATKKMMFADYRGNRYFFCCSGCPTAFKRNPAKYAKSPHIKTPPSKKG